MPDSARALHDGFGNIAGIGVNGKESAAVSMNFKPYITRDPAICGGEAVVTGTRITVRTILASLAEGMSAEQILADFPTLTPDGLRAVIAFAAVSAEEDLPLAAPPALA